MEKQAVISPFKPVLDELEALLAQEREVLRKPNASVLAEMAEQKQRLDASLLQLAEQARPSATERNQLARIQRAARINQLLLVHARSCVQGALQMITGETYNAPTLRQSPTVQSPVAINIRG